MSNMSYCRFNNTLYDLRDCRITLDSLYDKELDEKISAAELAKAAHLIRLCREIACDFANIAGYTDDEFDGKTVKDIKTKLEGFNVKIKPDDSED